MQDKPAAKAARVEQPLFRGLVLREPVPAAVRMLCRRDSAPRRSAGVVAAMKN
jgi:hypothetical protein